MDTSSEQHFSRSRVSIMGRQYTLKGDLDPDYMALLARKVDQKIEELRAIAPNMDTLQLVILTALNYADELEQFKKEHGEEPVGDEIGEKALSLITMLEKGIIGD